MYFYQYTPSSLTLLFIKKFSGIISLKSLIKLKHSQLAFNSLIDLPDSFKTSSIVNTKVLFISS